MELNENGCGGGWSCVSQEDLRGGAVLAIPESLDLVAKAINAVAS